MQRLHLNGTAEKTDKEVATKQLFARKVGDAIHGLSLFLVKYFFPHECLGCGCVQYVSSR